MFDAVAVGTKRDDVADDVITTVLARSKTMAIAIGLVPPAEGAGLHADREDLRRSRPEVAPKLDAVLLPMVALAELSEAAVSFQADQVVTASDRTTRSNLQGLRRSGFAPVVAHSVLQSMVFLAEDAPLLMTFVSGWSAAIWY